MSYRTTGLVTVTVLQEYVPAYRAPFFAALRSELLSRGVELKVAAGMPGRDALRRQDTSEDPPDIRVHQREFRFFGKRLTLRLLPRAVLKSNLIVVEQARRNLDTYALLGIPAYARKTAIWGHGEDTVHRPNLLNRWILSVLTRRAVRVFTYTDAGRDAVVEAGIEPERVSVVQNSVDTRSLRRAVLGVTTMQARDWRRAHEISDGAPCVAFIGALDSSKRIDLLAGAWRILSKSHPDAHLIVAGVGPAASFISSEERVLLIGYAGDDIKAILAHVASAIVIPGRVGLVALDAAAMALPIVTTTAERNAPEFAYLKPGYSCVVVDGSVNSLVAAMSKALAGDYAGIGKAAQAAGGAWTVEAMAHNFASGVLKSLAVSQRPKMRRT